MQSSWNQYRRLYEASGYVYPIHFMQHELVKTIWCDIYNAIDQAAGLTASTGGTESLKLMNGKMVSEDHSFWQQTIRWLGE